MLTRRFFFALALAPFCKPKPALPVVNTCVALKKREMSDGCDGTLGSCIGPRGVDSMQAAVDAARRLGETLSAAGEKMQLRETTE